MKKSDKECIIFVTTFGSIAQRVLPLIEELKDKGKITIVVSTEQLEKFFKENTTFKVIRTRVPSDLIEGESKIKIFPNVIRSKYEYKELFRDMKNYEIYFSNTACSIVTYSYIKKLSMNNRVFFFGEQSEEKSMEFPIKKGFTSFIMKLIAKCFLDTETIIQTRAGVPFYNLDDKFFENITKIKAPPEDKKITAIYTKKLDILKGKKILIAVTDSITCGFIEKEEFMDKIDRLMDILEDMAPGEYAIKPHPRLDRLYGKMSKTTSVIPSYIPLQFILEHDWKRVIGFDSGSLIPASNNTNAEVISLMDATKYKDENLKKKMRNHLVNKSQNKIKFVKKIDDLKYLLK